MENTDSIDTPPSPQQNDSSKHIKIHIVEKGETTRTILFSGINHSEENIHHVRSVIHPDDSIRAIKKKLLLELYFGKWSSSIKIKPAYEEIYFYGYIQERAAFVRMFQELMQSLGQNSLSKEQAHTLFQTLGLSVELALEEYSYEDLQSIVLNQEQILSIKIPIGMSFLNTRDYTFEVDPFRFIGSAYAEPDNLFLFENKLLLNFGELVGNEIYACFTEKVFDTEFGPDKEEYLIRYYYPLLYKAGVRSKSDWQSMRGKLVGDTRDMLDEKLKNLYKSVELFHKINETGEKIDYTKNGICKTLIQIKNEKSTNVSLEMIFKSIHCSIHIPFIKYNPGSRRENLYRLYYEKIARNGKKIPYLSKTAIWRLSKETGKKQQVSLFIETEDLKYYLHIEINGNIMIELDMGNKTMTETELDAVLVKTVNPTIDLLNIQIMQTSVILPKFISLRDVGTQIVDMQYCLKTHISRQVSLEKIPCIYSLFTFNKEIDKNKRETSVIRYRRVENFQEMDAEAALILEMLQQAGYTETSFADIVDTLVERFQMKEEDAKVLLANYYTRYLQVGGEVIEKPGFIVSMETITEDSSLEIKVAGITSVKYIESLFAYFNAIINISQHAKKHTATINKMTVMCGTGMKKTTIGNADMAITDNVVAVNEGVAAGILAANVEMGFVTGKKEADELFRQFGIFDEEDEDEDSDKAPVLHPLEKDETFFEEDIVDVSVDELLKELRENVDEVRQEEDVKKPILYEDEEEEEEDEEEEEEQEEEGEQKENSMFDSMLSIFKKKPEEVEETKESEEEAEEVETKVSEEAEEVETKVSEEAEEVETKESEEAVEEEAKEPPKEEPKFAKTTGPIFYEDEEEEEEEDSRKKSYSGGATTTTENGSPENEKYKLKPDGMPLQPNPFLKRLQRADPALFLAKPVGKFGNYSTSCQPVSRHPVVLSKEEFDSVDPESYKEHIKYGTDETHQNYYICPKYWCFLTDKTIQMTDKLPPGRPISEKDVLAGKCGRIIDKKDKKVPPGAYALKMSDTQQYPGFKLDSHPDGHCLPCCAKQWDSEKQIKSRQKCLTPQKETAPQKGKKIAKKTQQYVISSDTYPISIMRWGFLPIPVQFFLNIDYDSVIDKNIAGVVLPDSPVLLRWGVEHPKNQSILGLFADIYAYKQKIETPSIKVFKQLLVEKITIDLFARIHNGSLPSIFRPASPPTDIVIKYTAQIKASKFAGKLSTEKSGERILLENVVSAYDNFLNYIRDDNVKIDHTYMWDLICEPGAVIPGTKGLNLVIMEMNENDMTGRIELICPTSTHSRNQFEENRENILVLKHEEFYEPIYLCTFKNIPGANPFESVKTFTVENTHPALVDVLRNIEASTKKYCPALPSLPKVYKYRSPISLKKLVKMVETLQYTIEYQIINYSEKVIGLGIRTKTGEKAIYVPCAATANMENYPVKYMDDLDLLGDYEIVKTSLTELHKQSNGEIPCHPVFKVLEGELLVGFITETNQFIPIVPTENIHMDNLKIHPSVSHIQADVVLQSTREGEKERILMTKKIKLETQFYNVFRNTIRKILAEFGNRILKKELQAILENRALLEKQKRVKVEEKLREVVGPAIIFVDIDDAVLMELEEVNECSGAEQNDPYCLVKENGVAQLSIPAKHLLAEEYSNEKVYYGRLSDELIRNERVRLFMLNTRNYTNVGNIEYSIKGDEFIIAQSALTTDYFQNIDTFESNKYAVNSVFDSAQPSISVLYPDEPISYEEQYKKKVKVVKDTECIVEEKEIIGNNRNFWKRTFPQNAREIVYRETESCSWMVLMELWKHKHGESTAITIASLREMLRESYKELIAMNPSYSQKLATILKTQGKSKMMEPVLKNKTSLENIIDENYYLTDIDIWVFCWKYNLPVVVFNTNGLKGFSRKGLQWLKMGGEARDVYVFVRSNIGSFANKIYSYHLIRPYFKLSELPEFERMVQEGALSGSEYRPNVENLKEFLDKLTIIKLDR